MLTPSISGGNVVTKDQGFEATGKGNPNQKKVEKSGVLALMLPVSEKLMGVASQSGMFPQKVPLMDCERSVVKLPSFWPVPTERKLPV